MPLLSADDSACSEASTALLTDAYRFLVREWPRAPRTDEPDEGFESLFRQSLARSALTWRVSYRREMGLGAGRDTSSGIRHELDLVVSNGAAVLFFELKNTGPETGKNEVIVFFAKVLDYLAANAELASAELSPVFVSTSGYDEHALAACLGLGVHPVGYTLRPVPVLHRMIQHLCVELDKSPWIDKPFRDDSADLVARFRELNVSLRETWFERRIGRLSEDSISLKRSLAEGVVDLGRELRDLNASFEDLLKRWERLKARATA